MGNSFGFLRTESEGGFQFTVLEACKAEDVDLVQTCDLTFGANHELVSIGNVTRGTMVPQPGIAGIGIWFAMILFFGVVVIAVVFVVLEVLTRSTSPDSTVFAFFRDKPSKDPNDPNAKPTWGDKLRAAGRTFVLGVSDTQTIFVGAFLLGFAGQSKCKLTSYHFAVAVNQMMIALAVITFSVALVRTYWRNPLAAAFRLILSTGAFIGVGLTIFRKANYAPDWPPPDTRKDSAILLPVACLLESDLRLHAQDQADKSQAELGFGKSTDWPGDRILFILLVVAFLFGHISIPIRFAESRGHAPARWTQYRGFVTVAYWALMLIPPTFTSVWCWVRVYQTRDWVKKSGWIASPNPEMIVWDSGQIIAMGVLITVIMNMLTEALERDKKDANQKQREQSEALDGADEAHELILVKPNLPPSWQVQDGYEPYRPYTWSSLPLRALGSDKLQATTSLSSVASSHTTSTTSTPPPCSPASRATHDGQDKSISVERRQTHSGPQAPAQDRKPPSTEHRQDRAQRQRERDTLHAAKRIQRVWRGHSARRIVADDLRREWDAVEGSASASQARAYDSQEEALLQLQRLLRFASTRNEDDLRRIQYYGLRRRETVRELGAASTGPWPSAYLRLQRILLIAIERQSRLPSASWDQIGYSLSILHFIADQIPAETSQNAEQYYRALAHVASKLAPTLEASGTATSDLWETIVGSVLSPLKKVTGYTLDAYEAFGVHFLTLPLLSSDSASPSIQKFRDSLADAINYKLLANALATLFKKSGLQGKPELSSIPSRLRLLGSFIYFHRYAHNFDTPEAYAVHKDFVAVVSTLLNSLPVNVVDNVHPISEISEDDGVDQDSNKVTDFSKEQVGSLVHQEGIGSLLAGSSQSTEASDEEKIEEARQLANYALALLRFFPRRGDEIRMWLYIGPSDAPGKNARNQPAIRYFWQASKQSSVFATIFRDSRAAIGLLKSKSSNVVSSDRPGTSGLTQHGFWQPAQQQIDRDAVITDEWRVILVFLELYTFVLKVTDDEEFFSAGKQDIYSGQVRDNGLPLSEVKDLTTFLKNLGFTLYFNAADVTSADEGAVNSGGLSYFNPKAIDFQAQKEPVEPSIGGVAGLKIDYVKGLVTGLLRMIYERDSRRKFLPSDHWLMTSRFDMTGFIAAVVEEEESRHKIQEEDADDLDDQEEEYDDTPQLIGTSRTQQQRRLEKLQRQQRKASRRRYLQAVAPRLEILQNMPFFIPFTTRVQIFREFVHLDMTKRRGSSDPELWRFRLMQQPNARGQFEKHTAQIRRENEFDDAFEQFYSLGQGLKEPIQITFLDQFGSPEAGIDGGGVTKEFLTSVTSRAFMPTDYIDMFVENDQHLLYPNPAAVEEHKEALRQAGLRENSPDFRVQISELLQRYEFLGRIIGKCLYEGILVDVNFAPFFLRKWALTGGAGSAPNESGYRPTLNDLRDLDEELYQGLHKLKTYPGDVEDFSLNFTVTDTVVVDHTTTPKKTKAITKELKPDGANTPVTNQNRLVYISYMARHRLQNQPYAQTAAFLRGLSTMVQPSWLSMFNQSELQTLISGTRTSIDIEDLRRNTIYGGTYVVGDDGLEHPTIRLLWKVMKEMSDDERRAVLKFVTSTPRAPLLGFGTLNPRFSIRDAGSDQERLPSTSTCVNLLKLPMYRDEDTLKEKLLYSVFSGAGFDLS